MIRRIDCGMVNCYLIKGDHGDILVDTGTQKDGPYVYEQVKNEDVEMIVLTHGHSDHVGGAAYLGHKLQVPIGIHRRDYELCKDNGIHKVDGRGLWRIVSNITMKHMKIEPFEPSLFLMQGQGFLCQGIEGEIIELPGHTMGSIGLLVNKTDFIIGDILMNFRNPVPANIYEDKEAMEKSLEVIKHSGAKTLYLGHGKPISLKEYFSR